MKTVLPPLAALVLTLTAPTASADQFIAENLSVDGQGCFGDCVSGEPFASTTIDLKIKSAGPLLVFEDTSSGADRTDDWNIGKISTIF